MIHIYHGEQTTASRKELTELKAKFSSQEVITLDGKTVSLTELTQATESTSLFNDKRLVIVENFLSRRLTKKSSEAKVIEKWLTTIPDTAELVFWEDKEIGKTILSLFPAKTDRAVFKIDRLLFKLVESIRPGKTLELVTTLNESLRHDPAEFVFAMFVRQFRNLIIVKDLGTQASGMPSWQAGKLKRQAEYFSLPQLLSHYGQLLAIDDTIKRSNTPLSLDKELELFLLII